MVDLVRKTRALQEVKKWLPDEKKTVVGFVDHVQRNSIPDALNVHVFVKHITW